MVNEYRPVTTYSMDPIAGWPPWPTFGIADLLRTPAPFQVTKPALDGAIPPTIPSTFEIQWTTGEAGDFVALRMFRYGDNGSATVLKEEVRCLVADDGSFTVPASVWTDWETFYEIDVYVGRVLTTEESILPHNNSKSGLAGVYWVVGLGYQGFL